MVQCLCICGVLWKREQTEAEQLSSFGIAGREWRSEQKRGYPGWPHKYCKAFFGLNQYYLEFLRVQRPTGSCPSLQEDC